MIAQLTVKTNSEEALYFLSLMSCSINKLKSHLLFTCKSFLFSILWGKNFYCSRKWWWWWWWWGGATLPLLSLRPCRYIFRIKILSRDTPSFHWLDWLKNKRDNEVEIGCSMSKIKYGECEWYGLWSVNESDGNE